MIYEILAYILIILHFAWIIFMIYGFILTIRGFWRPAFWDRWLFRTIHLLGILFVAAMPILNRLCPLTEWEYQLRQRIDPSTEKQRSFIIEWLERLIYPDVPIEVIVIPTIIIAGFTLLMYIIRPPEKIRRLFHRSAA